MTKSLKQRIPLVRKMIQNGIAYISEPDLCTILGMEKKSLNMWQMETGDKFPIEAYWMSNGPFKQVIYPIVSVLEYLAGPELAIQILESEGIIT